MPNSIMINLHVECPSEEGTLDFELFKRSSVPFLGERLKTKYKGQFHLEEIKLLPEDCPKEIWIDMTYPLDSKSPTTNQESQNVFYPRLCIEFTLAEKSSRIISPVKSV